MAILEDIIAHTKSSLSSRDIEKYNKIKIQIEGGEKQKSLILVWGSNKNDYGY